MDRVKQLLRPELDARMPELNALEADGRDYTWTVWVCAKHANRVSARATGRFYELFPGKALPAENLVAARVRCSLHPGRPDKDRTEFKLTFDQNPGEVVPEWEGAGLPRTRDLAVWVAYIGEYFEPIGASFVAYTIARMGAAYYVDINAVPLWPGLARQHDAPNLNEIELVTPVNRFVHRVEIFPAPALARCISEPRTGWYA
jgi:hypothetical protein